MSEDEHGPRSISIVPEVRLPEIKLPKRIQEALSVSSSQIPSHGDIEQILARSAGERKDEHPTEIVDFADRRTALGSTTMDIAVEGAGDDRLVAEHQRKDALEKAQAEVTGVIEDTVGRAIRTVESVAGNMAGYHDARWEKALERSRAEENKLRSVIDRLDSERGNPQNDRVRLARDLRMEREFQREAKNRIEAFAKRDQFFAEALADYKGIKALAGSSASTKREVAFLTEALGNHQVTIGDYLTFLREERARVAQDRSLNFFTRNARDIRLAHRQNIAHIWLGHEKVAREKQPQYFPAQERPAPTAQSVAPLERAPATNTIRGDRVIVPVEFDDDESLEEETTQVNAKPVLAEQPSAEERPRIVLDQMLLSSPDDDVVITEAEEENGSEDNVHLSESDVDDVNVGLTEADEYDSLTTEPAKAGPLFTDEQLEERGYISQSQRRQKRPQREDFFEKGMNREEMYKAQGEFEKATKEWNALQEKEMAHAKEQERVFAIERTKLDTEYKKKEKLWRRAFCEKIHEMNPEAFFLYAEHLHEEWMSLKRYLEEDLGIQFIGSGLMEAQVDYDSNPAFERYAEFFFLSNLARHIEEEARSIQHKFTHTDVVGLLRGIESASRTPKNGDLSDRLIIRKMALRIAESNVSKESFDKMYLPGAKGEPVEPKNPEAIPPAIVSPRASVAQRPTSFLGRWVRRAAIIMGVLAPSPIGEEPRIQHALSVDRDNIGVDIDKDLDKDEDLDLDVDDKDKDKEEELMLDADDEELALDQEDAEEKEFDGYVTGNIEKGGTVWHEAEEVLRGVGIENSKNKEIVLLTRVILDGNHIDSPEELRPGQDLDLTRATWLAEKLKEGKSAEELWQKAGYQGEIKLKL